jgi:hypothetical protein
LSFRICVYPSPEEANLYIAHCLEVDLTGVGKCLETALTELLENIDTQQEICQETGAQFFVPAPGHVWQSYEYARKAKRKIPDELMERVFNDANRRLGHEPPTVDYALASKRVPKRLLAVPA